MQVDRDELRHLENRGASTSAEFTKLETIPEESGEDGDENEGLTKQQIARGR